MKLEKDYGSVPSLDSEAYVIGFLGLTTIKANVNAFMHFGGAIESDIQEKLIEIGSELLLGTIDPDKYVDKYEKVMISALPKDQQEGVKFDDYTKEQIKMRIMRNHGLYSKKDKNKLRESVHYFPLVLNLIKNNSPISYSEILTHLGVSTPHFVKEVKQALEDLDNRGLIQTEQNGNEVTYSWVQRLEEAVDLKPQILQFIQGNPHTSYNNILAHLGVDPKSGRAIPVYHAVKALLDNRTIQREKVGKGFAYSVAGTAPAPQPELPKKDVGTDVAPSTQSSTGTKYKERDPQKVIAIYGAGEAGIEKARKELNHAKQIAFHTLPQTAEKAKEQGVLSKFKLVHGAIKDIVAQIDILKNNMGAEPTSDKAEVPAATGKTDYKEIVMDMIGKHPHVTAGQVLASLGIQPGTPKQIAVYKAMQDLLVTGAIKREKDGKVFKYTKGDGTPVELPKVTRTKYKSMDEVVAVVNKHWRWNNWTLDYGNWLNCETGDRGPRQDHGGESGDGWMGSAELARASKPYSDKWVPRLKELEKALKAEKIIAKGSFDYGEKGHISLGLNIIEPKFEKKKEESVNEDFHGSNQTPEIIELPDGAKMANYTGCVVKENPVKPGSFKVYPNVDQIVYAIGQGGHGFSVSNLEAVQIYEISNGIILADDNGIETRLAFRVSDAGVNGDKIAYFQKAD